jgi:hypothetical protein
MLDTHYREWQRDVDLRAMLVWRMDGTEPECHTTQLCSEDGVDFLVISVFGDGMLWPSGPECPDRAKQALLLAWRAFWLLRQDLVDLSAWNRVLTLAVHGPRADTHPLTTLEDATIFMDPSEAFWDPELPGAAAHRREVRNSWCNHAKPYLAIRALEMDAHRGEEPF